MREILPSTVVQWKSRAKQLLGSFYLTCSNDYSLVQQTWSLLTHQYQNSGLFYVVLNTYTNIPIYKCIHSLSLFSFPLDFLSLSVGLFFSFSFFLFLLVVVCCKPVVWWSLPVAFRIAAETQFADWCLSLAFTHCRELMKSVGKLW